MIEFDSNMQNNAENDKVVVQIIFQLVKWMKYHLQLLSQRSYIKETNIKILAWKIQTTEKKIKELGQLPEGKILSRIDVVGLYPNIPYDEGLESLKEFLNSRVDQQVKTDTLTELVELVLKNNIFEFDQKT